MPAARVGLLFACIRTAAAPQTCARAPHHLRRAAVKSAARPMAALGVSGFAPAASLPLRGADEAPACRRAQAPDANKLRESASPARPDDGGPLRTPSRDPSISMVVLH